MTKRKLKFISFVLSLIIVVGIIPISSVAAAEKMTEQTAIGNQHQIVGSPDDEFNDFGIKLGAGEKTVEELSQLNISNAALPEMIPYEDAVSKGHVNRLDEQENDLYTIIYQNKDGSKTSYKFANPVKYIDADGKIKDKSTKLSVSSDSKYAYAMEDNSLKAYFPGHSNTGISLVFGEYAMSMTPVSAADGAHISYDSTFNSVTYANAFGANTSIVYSTQLSGLKEDIVLNKYTGQNSFDFDLDLTGLTVSQYEGQWRLLNAEEEIVAVFSDIITKDANGKMIVGDLNIVENENGYKMTVTVPEAYLTSPSTVYPVYIDPTTYIWEETYFYDENGNEQYTPSIIDVGMYNTSLENVLTTEGYHDLGGTSPEGRMIIKLPDFYKAIGNGYMNLNQYQIANVTLNMYVETSSATTISVDPSGTTWDPLEYGEDPDYLDYMTDVWYIYEYEGEYPTINKSVSQSGEIQIDITEFVKNWTYYNLSGYYDEYYNPENGLIISATSSCKVRSTDYSSSNDIYVVMDYSTIGGDYFTYSLKQYEFIINDSNSLALGSFSSNSQFRWIIEYIGNNEYYIYSAYNKRALSASGTSLVLSALPTTPTNEYKWIITAATGGGAIIKNVSTQYVIYHSGISFSLISQPSTGSSSYDYARWGILRYADYIATTDISLSDDWIKTNTSKYLNLRTTPSNASWRSAHFYNWTISNTSVISNSTSSPSLMTANAGGVITLTLTNKLTGFSKSFRITSGVLREGEYKLMNKGSYKYMDIHGPSMDSGTYIHQWEEHTGIQQKWILTIDSISGGYIIQSVYSGLYLRVENGSSASGAYMIQFENSNWTSNRWYITETSSGGYRITPALVSSFALSIPNSSTSNGTKLIQAAYTADSNYYDEWNIVNISDRPGIIEGAYYTIKNTVGNRVLDVSGAGTTDGTDIIQNTEDPKAFNQTWQFISVGDGNYKIKDVNSGKLLSVYANSSGAGANINLWYDNDSSGQIFKIYENSDGSYSFYSQSSGYSKAVGIPNSSTSSGASVKQINTTAGSYKFLLTADKIELYLCASGMNGSNTHAGSFGGHAWFEINNTTGEMLSIGYYTMQRGEYISLGTWGADEYKGIWYNRESYAYYRESKYVDTTVVKTLINKSEIASISEYTIKKNIGHSYVYNNCVDYVVNAWNLIHSDSSIPIAGVSAYTAFYAVRVAMPELLETYMKLHFDTYSAGDRHLAIKYGYYNSGFHWTYM